jgi:hypothetical protein
VLFHSGANFAPVSYLSSNGRRDDTNSAVALTKPKTLTCNRKLEKNKNRSPASQRGFRLSNKLRWANSNRTV